MFIGGEEYKAKKEKQMKQYRYMAKWKEAHKDELEKRTEKYKSYKRSDNDEQIQSEKD